jgi:hypothetical protein
MVIEDKDILQLDATIIAGALVLLTVSSIAPGSLITQRTLISIASMLIILFGLSALSILRRNRSDYFLISALGTLIAVMSLIMIANLILIFSPFDLFTILLEDDGSRDTSVYNQSNSSMNDKVNNTKNYSSVSESRSAILQQL